MRILVLGANGFIGTSVVTRLIADGHQVTGFGRHVERAKHKRAAVEWVAGDLAAMASAETWRDLIDGKQAIVNCAGALQDGLADDLAASQDRAMAALYKAASLAGVGRIIQISARTDGGAGTLPFLATKRRADEALAASELEYVILRPALVLGRNAHGGSALLRALASMPFALPLIHAGSKVQTVAVDDVAEAVATAVNGRLPSGADIDLAAEEQMTLGELVQLHRQWLGLAPAKIVAVPSAAGRIITYLADIAGQLGWRSPLRSTAMKVMEAGVTIRQSVQAPALARTAQQTLDAHPSGVQDLWFARLYLLKPIVIVSLAAFWLLSGLVPLANPSRAATHFLPFMSPAMAMGVTLATCALDMALGLFVLMRPFARKAMIGMLIVSASYLAGGTILEPSLWLDPLGPLVKVLPSIALCFVALATLDER